MAAAFERGGFLCFRHGRNSTASLYSDLMKYPHRGVTKTAVRRTRLSKQPRLFPTGGNVPKAGSNPEMHNDQDRTRTGINTPREMSTDRLVNSDETEALLKYV